MKKVLILFGKMPWKKSTPPPDPKYRKCYECLYSLAESHGIKLYRASSEWLDFKKKKFKQAWTFDKTNGWHRIHNIRPNLIFNKAPSLNEKERLKFAKLIPTINNPFFDKVVNNKFATYLLFKKFNAPDFLCFQQGKLRGSGKKNKELKGYLKTLKGRGSKGDKNCKKI